MKNLFRSIIVIITIAASGFSYAFQITQSHPNIDFGLGGPVHVFVLSNGATLKVRTGDPGRLKDPSAVGQPETSAEHWQIGDEVDAVILTALEWETHNSPPGGNWEEKRSPVVINRSRANTFLILWEYINSPLTWEGSRIKKIDFTWPHTNQKATWLQTSSHGYMVPDPGLNLEDWKAGDSLRFRAYESSTRITWLIYNERTGIYAYPFFEYSSLDQVSPPGSSGVAYKDIFPDWTGSHNGVFPQDWWKKN